MSDWLLLGVDPRDESGREFYVHTAEEWFDIVELIASALANQFPIDPDYPLGHLEDGDCLTLAGILDAFLDSGHAQDFIDQSGWFTNVETLTLENLQRFSRFLRHCGGFLFDPGG